MKVNACDCGCKRLRLNLSATSAWISCSDCGAMGDIWTPYEDDDRPAAFGAADLWNQYPHTQHPAEALAARSSASPEALPSTKGLAAARLPTIADPVKGDGR